MRIAACILAAGAGRRMGREKAGVELDGRSFTARLLEAYAAVAIGPLYVVGRSSVPAVSAACLEHEARLLLNPDPDRGMLSSLHVCLRQLMADGREAGAGVEALFVNPVDCPRVRPETIATLAREFVASRSPLVVPQYRGRRGHPVLFGASLFEELLQAPLDVGARAVVWAHAAERLEVVVEDPGVLDDLDTPADLAALGVTAPAVQRNR